jgi:hypothetical protein
MATKGSSPGGLSYLSGITVNNSDTSIFATQNNVRGFLVIILS